MKLSVLRSTADWVAVDKPMGMPVIPGRPSETQGPVVRRLLEAQLDQQVWVVHRLDRDTSGVLLFALNAQTHRALSMAFEHGQVTKRYLALVHGAVSGPWVSEQPLVPARRGRMRVARAGETGKPARTRFAVRQTWKTASLVEAWPETGRTHQIRVHLLAAGHPLLVDHQYGRPNFWEVKDEVVLARTPLHASRVTFSLHGAEETVEAQLPADMQRAKILLDSGL